MASLITTFTSLPVTGCTNWHGRHYSSWLETMFAQFGQTCLCLHRGPAWQYTMVEILDPKCREIVMHAPPGEGQSKAEN